MKITNIKTSEEFYEFADIWYQRTHNLRRIWQNENETEKRRAKAFMLWLRMHNRVMKLVPLAIRINNPNNKKAPDCSGAKTTP
jgi:uncharacterized protein YhaN